MDEFLFEKLDTSHNKGMTVRSKVMILMLIVAVFAFGWLIYINYIWVKTGKMEEAIQVSKKNKRNKEYWNANDIG